MPGLSSAAAFDRNPLQPREIIVKKDDDPTGRKSGQSEPIFSLTEDLPQALAVIFEDHRPSRMPFFERLAGLPRAVARDPALLGQIHLVYQSAMHATRAAVYYLPHLDSPDCAIAYWGLAMSAMPNPLVPPFPLTVIKTAQEAIQQGKTAKTQSPREAEYLAAIDILQRLRQHSLPAACRGLRAGDAAAQRTLPR